MFEIQVLIPLANNESRTFTEAHHQQFEREILTRFGGLSRLPDVIAGQWMESGQTYRDDLRVYVIAMKSIVQGNLIGELADIAKSHYSQYAIYIRYLGISETI